MKKILIAFMVSICFVFLAIPVMANEDDIKLQEVNYPELTNPYDTYKLPFKDVKETDWFYEDVKSCSYGDQKLIHGINAETFAPYENITRADFMMILYRFYDKYASEGQFGTNTPAFNDVPSDQYYSEAIYWGGAESKIIEGKGNNTFDPFGKITRQEMDAIAAKYFIFDFNQTFDVETAIDEFMEVFIDEFGEEFSLIPAFKDKNSFSPWAVKL